MPDEQVVVIGVGMMTAVGLSAAETAASVRAGIAQFAESRLRDQRLEPFTLAEVADAKLPALVPAVAAVPDLTDREARMLRMASAALVECLEPLAGQGVRPPLILALPEIGTSTPLDPVAFLDWLRAQSGAGIDADRSDATYLGRAGGLLAIGHAIDIIRSGRVGFAIAGGLDSYRDPEVLRALDVAARVKSALNLDGFIPGEGAGFLLLAGAAAAARARLTPLATLSGVSYAFEPGHLGSGEPYRGDGLATVIRQLVEPGVGAPIAEVFSSMNGESHWGKEWGVGFIRNGGAFAGEHGLHHPADSFGDTGAAAGPLMVGLAALGMAAGYRGTPALVYGSSDGGDRSALLVYGN